MKILFCTSELSDYGLDTLFDGLCRLFGPENIFDYPEKANLHGQTPSRLPWYPNIFDYPVFATPAQKIDMLRENKFDLILAGCRAAIGLPYDDFYELLKEKSKTIPTYLIDQGDEPGINSGMIAELNARLYFKREYFRHHIEDPKIIPLSFSYSMKYVSDNIEGGRKNALFWAGKVIPSRQPFVSICQSRRGKPFYGFPQERYRVHMSEHTIGLNLKGVGNDTVRYYEIPAHGTMLFSEKPDFYIENGFTDGKTAVMFESPEEMVEKLDYCLKNPDYTERIRLAGYRWFMKHHTTMTRAQQLMDKINLA